VNYLLPEHTAAVNNDVADRKLRQELTEHMHQLSLDKDPKPRTDMSEVDAQLDSLRQPLSSLTTDSLTVISSTVSEWNEGFFKPRGVYIAVGEVKPQTPDEDPNRMPGTWIPYDHEILAESPKDDSSRKGLFGSFKTFPGMESNAGSFRIGPIVADNDGLRIGKNGLVVSITFQPFFTLDA